MARALNWLVLAYVAGLRVAVAALLAVPCARWQWRQAEMALRWAVVEYIRREMA